MLESLQLTEHVEFLNPITISVKKYSTKGQTFVKTDEFRPFPSLSHPSLADWRNDTSYLFNLLSNTDFDYDDYFNCLTRICQNHIDKYGRLIDTDLYNYIDEMLLIIKAGVALDGTVFPREAGRAEWGNFQKAMFSRFSNDIWVHSRSANPIAGVQLVRLSDSNEVF